MNLLKAENGYLRKWCRRKFWVQSLKRFGIRGKYFSPNVFRLGLKPLQNLLHQNNY